jgi:DNA repair exonuclease SbcCD ATPase subunit
MSSLRKTIEKMKKLEAEKKSLLLEFEKLNEMADVKAASLEYEIASLREEIKSVKMLMEQERKQQPSSKAPQVPKVSAKDLVEKTLIESNRLGNQVFPLPPFGQYFDNWLVNLRQMVSEFESNSTIEVDEQFGKDRSQVLRDVESALARIRLEESNLSQDEKALADNNRLLEEADEEYSEKTKALSSKRDSEVERLTKRIHELENEIANREKLNQEKPKIGIFSYRSRKEYNLAMEKAAEELNRNNEDLKATMDELEASVKGFSVDQKNLDNEYEKRKQGITERSESLRKELEKLETDTSIEARREASNALANAINALIQRTHQTLE